MRVTDGEFTANDEVDEMRWLARRGAAALLTYEHDRRLVQALGDGRHLPT